MNGPVEKKESGSRTQRKTDKLRNKQDRGTYSQVPEIPKQDLITSSIWVRTYNPGYCSSKLCLLRCRGLHLNQKRFVKTPNFFFEPERLLFFFLVCCLTSQQHASVSQGRVYSDKRTCCHAETEVADQTCYLTQSQYNDSGPTSPIADPITPGAWHWSASF